MWQLGLGWLLQGGRTAVGVLQVLWRCTGSAGVCSLAARFATLFLFCETGTLDSASLSLLAHMFEGACTLG